MIRIRLGQEDLRRIRIAETQNPFEETLAAAEQLREARPSPLFSSWRQSLAGRLGPELRPLAAIHPVGLPGLDLSSIVGTAVGSAGLASPADAVDAGIDALLSARRQRVRAEIDWLCGFQPPVDWPWTRLDTELELRRELGSAIARFHAAAVGPYWPRIRGYLQAERVGQVERLGTAGLDAFLSGLCPPLVQWDPPVLTIWDAVAAEREVDLGGSGLTFASSAFLSPAPVLLIDPGGSGYSPRLVYPAIRDLGQACELWTSPGDRRALARLLGPTRGAVLEAIADGCGTGELARRVRISPAAASQHAAVLRRAGLITTQRTGRSVAHALTTLGSALLNGRACARS